MRYGKHRKQYRKHYGQPFKQTLYRLTLVFAVKRLGVLSGNRAHSAGRAGLKNNANY
jgi:hypothetical protein